MYEIIINPASAIVHAQIIYEKMSRLLSQKYHFIEKFLSS